MAIPHVVALYQWLRGKPGASLPALGDDAFTATELDESTEQSAANKRIFVKIAQLRALKQEPDAKDLKSAWFDSSEDYAGLVDFIEFIRGQNEQAHPNPLQVTLSYLLQHPETATHSLDAFNILLMIWLSTKPNEGCAWYEDDDVQETLLSNHQEIHLALGRQVTEHYQQEARALFKSVENPLGLLPLFAEHYDNPQRIAAFIIGLLERKVTADVIIKSGLFHEYLLGNIDRMGTSSNPVTQLYRLLNTFAIAEPLSSQAKLTSVMTARGANEAFKNYSLDGAEHSGHEAKALQRTELSPITFNAVPQPDAFKPFYNLFGQRFLLNLLSLYSTSRDAGAKQLLEQQLNNLSSEGVSQQELVQLLNVLAREDKEPLLRAVAELLQETTITALIESGNFAVFHLILFKAGLLGKLNPAQVQRYIGSLKPSDNQFDHLILLRTMLLQLKDRSEEHT